MNQNREYLGTGWKFPLQVTPGGRIAGSAYELRVEESIFLILSTAPGERLMLPEFGCGMQDLVFAPNNESTISEVIHLVQEALTQQEPRIDVFDVNAESAPDQPNLLLIRVDYRIRANHAIGNVVYPFYLKESQ
jgi:phage baseplate assembly protein W